MSYLADLEAERLRYMEFWTSESARKWFEEQGYFLYESVDNVDKKYEYARPTREYPDTPPVPYRFNATDVLEDPFPYAFMGPGTVSGSSRPPYSTWDELAGPIMYAQDVQGRHVAIKMLKNEEEFKVSSLLKDQSRLRDPESFPSVIPILDLLQRESQWFAVMPRWGANQNHKTFFPTFHLAIRYIISLLEGLAFLHELRIFHRDIHERNTLVNHIAGRLALYLAEAEYHKHLKNLGMLRYAIMDFDLAMVLDEKTYGAKPRLPIKVLMEVFAYPPPYESMHAYVDFDPFKYDVACLGIHFADHFQQIIPDVPLLAPLIDRMLTPNIDKRFTASEALEFARAILPTVSPQATFEREPKVAPVYWHLIDRWEGLPETFIAEWGSYRENPFSYTMRFQNWLFFKSDTYPLAWNLMYYFRYSIRIAVWLPRTILHYLSPSW